MFGKRIRQLRLANGLSIRGLAKRMNCVSPQAISNYENDRDVPGSDVIIAMARALGVTVGSFFQRTEVQLGTPAYRAKSGFTKKKMLALQNQVSIMVERHLEAESILGVESHTTWSLPPFMKDPVCSMQDVEDRAWQLRQSWGLSDQPIENLVELLEEKGILVVCMEDFEEFDGCTYPESPIPVVVVNSRGPGDRLRFNLAHELGHLVLTFPEAWDQRQREKAAMRFAGAFLLPAGKARRELGPKRTWLTLLELCELKKKYGLSVQALVYRARDLNILDDTAYRRFWASRGPQFRRQEIGPEYPRETTSRHSRLVARAYVDGLVSESRAAELLGKSIPEFRDIIMGGGVHCSDPDTLEARGEPA